ncbi:hypothetical protein FOZ63_031181 [Perkinsus olseni]|uniref:Uncharacterized protein n=1 Tax=Perkinsus olseni TaxID=32597 RepID=A0A7J6TIM4_PEROL|nr:hypothetical protein FOZ63_031181 [Perkinsus olseni]
MHPPFIVTVCILSVSHSLTRGLKILGRRYVGTIETSDNDKKITAELAFADTGNKVNMKFWSGDGAILNKGPVISALFDYGPQLPVLHDSPNIYALPQVDEFQRIKLTPGAYGMKPARMAAVFNRKLGNVVKADKGNFQWLYYGPSGPNRKADYIQMMIGGQLVKLRLIDHCPSSHVAVEYSEHGKTITMCC